MKVFIAAIGSAGDINPMLGVGTELSRRGHEVTILAGSWQAPAARKAGLRFEAVAGGRHLERMHASLRDSVYTGSDWAAFFRDTILPGTEPIFQHISGAVEPGNTLLIGPSWTVGLRLAAERWAVPLIAAMLQPRPLESGQHHDVFDRVFAPIVNRLRGRAGLRPLDGSLRDWLIYFDKTITLVPQWLIHPQVDEPNQGSMSDFVLFDPDVSSSMPREVTAFLKEHGRPVVFTFGTENDDVGWLFRIAMEACVRLGTPAVFLTSRGDQLPARLPGHILRADYVPLHLLLPHASVIVYHGGIGTCAQAMKAGLPHVVVPVAFDQFQNARRVEHLGVGIQMSHSDYGSHLSERLQEVLTSTRIHTRCRELREKFRPDSARACCDAILDLAFR